MLWEGTNDTLIKYVKNDLNISIHKESNFAKIRNVVIKELKKSSYKDLLDKKYELNSDITYLELHNIDNFMSIRFAFYALVVAVMVMKIGFNFEPYLEWALIILTVILITFRSFSDAQKDRMLYYKFKLDCINELLETPLQQNIKKGTR